jgi:16S rRNA (uracil1498-N3)-methyltransferase
MSRIHLPGPWAQGQEHPLPDSAHRHLVQVLRLREGDAVTVFDGEGHEADATLHAIGKRSGSVRIGTVHQPRRESPLDITLLQCVSKGDRMDYTLQKAVELGVTRVQPLRSERSVVKLDGDRWDKKQSHWEGVIVSACEQSGRVRIPPLLPVVPLDTALTALPADTLKLTLLPDADTSLRSLSVPAAGIALLIGPEGGLSAGEAARAQAAGFVAVHLGPRILRTETAGVATLAALQALWGDWQLENASC